MKKIIDLLEEEVSKAFENCGYDKDFGKVTVSARPDLCEFQCNGAMAAAKSHKKSPMIIAGEIEQKLKDINIFENISIVAPGFINLKVTAGFIANYCNSIIKAEKLGCVIKEGKTIVMDYGGPNVAKPLHVGHLRPAIIGESLKRIHRFFGDTVIGDVHLGDWGLQMGLIIEELKCRGLKSFTIDELEEIYPAASAKAKVDEEYKERARANTVLLQQKKGEYYEIFKKIVEVSVKDLKENYKKLNVEFDLWLGESDSQDYIEEMIEMMRNKGLVYESEGALVIDVAKPDDNVTINPCMVLKSDGAACYQTTDLATLLQREKDYKPDQVIYVVDKRQEMHFIQVFRAAKKAELVNPNAELIFVGFGTMNGKDGKPFKTRDGGVVKLESLIDEVNGKVYSKLMENRDIPEEEANETSKIIGLAALKYADLSNQVSKDYIFDLERFTSFEGNTGPYILYTIVRIKSIIRKYLEIHPESNEGAEILPPQENSEKNLMLIIAKCNEMIEQSYIYNEPHKICNYIYELSNAFSIFYHDIKILSSEEKKLKSYITLLYLVKDILETSIDLLGFSVPDRM